MIKPKIFHKRKSKASIRFITQPKTTGASQQLNKEKSSMVFVPAYRKSSIAVKKAPVTAPKISLPAFWFKQRGNNEMWKTFRQKRPVPHRKYSKHVYSFIDGIYGSY